MSTTKLYYDDMYLKEFDANIIRVEEMQDNKWSVVLDRTAFYPGGGGQPFDTGIINGVDVISVKEVNNEIIHITRSNPGKGLINAKINWQRRFDHMQQHSGEHIISSAFLQILGANNINFKIEETFSQIDFDIDSITLEQVNEIESLSNSIIFSNKPVCCSNVKKDELAQYNLRKKLEKEYEEIRLVKIENVDYCPCAGTHVSNTGEIGLIKISSWEKSKKGLRVKILCGERALYDYQMKNIIINDISKKLQTHESNISGKLNDQEESLNKIKNQLSEARGELINSKVDMLYKNTTDVNNTKLIVFDFKILDSGELTELANSLTSKENVIVLLGGFNMESEKVHLIFKSSSKLNINMDEQIKKILPIVEGKGGGNLKFAQGGGCRIDKLHEALKIANENILELIK